LVPSTKRLVAAAKILVAATIFLFPNFVAVTKPFFSVGSIIHTRLGFALNSGS